MTEQEQVLIRHDEAAHRFVVEVGGADAGFAEYRERASGAFDFVHTEIDPSYSGRGLGGTLVAAALERTRDLGRTIIPHCPFVAAWLRRHPDFAADVSWPDGASS